MGKDVLSELKRKLEIIQEEQAALIQGNLGWLVG